MSNDTSHKWYKGNGVLAGYLFLLSTILMCLATFYASAAESSKKWAQLKKNAFKHKTSHFMWRLLPTLFCICLLSGNIFCFLKSSSIKFGLCFLQSGWCESNLVIPKQEIYIAFMWCQCLLDTYNRKTERKAHLESNWELICPCLSSV